MKKLLLILFVIFSLNTEAQYVTNFAKNVNQNEIDGFYYYLPRNIIKIDFVIEEQQNVKGKYSIYAKEMLNTDDFIKENSTTYSIINVNTNILTEADPNYVFILSADEKNKDNLNVNLELTSDGVLKSFGYKNISTENSENISFENKMEYIDTEKEYNFIPIKDEDEDAVANNKMTDKELASQIINEIKKLRVAYFDLITGFQEVNYGNTMNYMIDELKNLEYEYLSMFLGKTNKRTFTMSFYVIPENGNRNYNITKFSENEGLNPKIGEIVKINFVDTSFSENINKLTKDNIENATYYNKIFYRNPANVTMQILVGENIISQNRLKISQFGDLILVPINKMKLTFDTNTGQIMSIIKE